MSKGLFSGFLQKSLSSLASNISEEKFNLDWIETTGEGDLCLFAYEYHRYDPLSGWGPQHLKQNDPCRYVFRESRGGSNLADIEPNLPDQFSWWGNWKVHMKESEDREGWIFSRSLDEFKDATTYRSRVTADEALEYSLRRRRWTRFIVKSTKLARDSANEDARKDQTSSSSSSTSAFKKFKMLLPSSLTSATPDAEDDTKSSSASSENRSRNESTTSKASVTDDVDVDTNRHTPTIPADEFEDRIDSSLEYDHVSIASEDIDDDWDERPSTAVSATTETSRLRMNAIEKLANDNDDDHQEISDTAGTKPVRDRHRRKTESALLQDEALLHRAENATQDADDKKSFQNLPESFHDDVLRGIGAALSAIESECTEIEESEQHDMETIHKDAYKVQIRELERRVKEMQDEMKKMISKSDLFPSFSFLGVGFSGSEDSSQGITDKDKSARYQQLQTELTAFIDTLDQMKKQYYFPLSKLKLGGNGIYIGINDVWMETISGQYVLDFVPNPRIPQVILLLCGESKSADSGMHIRLCVQGLRLRGDKGSHVPAMDMNEVKVTCSVRVAMSLQFNVEEEKWVSDPNMIKIEILAFRGPFGTRRQLLSTIIGLVTPIIRKKIIVALAPELGFFISSLSKPICVRGQYNIQGTSLHHVSDPISKSIDALSMLHWSERDAQSWMNLQKFLGRSDSNLLSSLLDVIGYYERFGSKGNMKSQWRQALLLWQQAAERYGELDSEAFSNGVSFNRLLSCAKKLARKPVSIHLGLQYIDGELSINQCLFYAHELCQRMIRTVEGEERKSGKQSKAVNQSSNPLITIASALERRYRQVERQLRIFANNVDFLSADLGIMMSGSANEATDAAWEDIGLSSFSPSRVGGHSTDVGILSVDVDDVEAQMSLGLHIPVIPFVYGLRRPAPFVVDVRPGEFGMMDIVIRHVMKEGGESGQVYRDAFPPDSSDEDDPDDYDDDDEEEEDADDDDDDAETDILGEGSPKNSLVNGETSEGSSRVTSEQKEAPTLKNSPRLASAKGPLNIRPLVAGRGSMTRTMSDLGILKKSRSSRNIATSETQNAGIAALSAAMIKRRELQGKNKFDLQYHLRKYIKMHSIRPLDTERTRSEIGSFASETQKNSNENLNATEPQSFKQSDSGSTQDDVDDDQSDTSDYQDVMMIRLRGPEVGLVVPKQFNRENTIMDVDRRLSGVASVEVPCLDPEANNHMLGKDNDDSLPAAVRESSWNQALNREKIEDNSHGVSIVNSAAVSAAYRRTINFSNQDFCGDEFDTVFGFAFLPGRPVAKWQKTDSPDSKQHKRSHVAKIEGKRSKLLTALSNLASSGNADNDGSGQNKQMSVTMTMDDIGSSAVVFSRDGVKMRLKVPEITIRSPLRSLLDFVKQCLANPELLRWYLPPDVAPHVRVILFLKESLSRLRKYIKHESFWFSSNLLGTVICGKRRSVTYDVYEGEHSRDTAAHQQATQKQRFPKFVGRFRGPVASDSETEKEAPIETPDVALIFSNGRGKKLRHQQRMMYNQASQRDNTDQNAKNDKGLASTSKSDDAADFRIVVDLYDVIDDARYLFSSMVLLLQFLGKDKARVMQERSQKRKKESKKRKKLETQGRE